MIGLGTMGRNLLLNMADHGFSVAGYDKSAEQVSVLEEEGRAKGINAYADLTTFIANLKKPKAVMLLVPAGKIVDAVIEELEPLLDEGDLIIDGGNSHYLDTRRRDDALEKKGLHFFGMGISGGSEGARKGPSMMPGGDKNAYKVNRDIHKVFEAWNNGRLQSFLVEITRDIFAFRTEGTDHLLLDDIKDQAKSKDTGKWTSQIAMDLNLPVSTIDTAVSMRDLSKYKPLRMQLGDIYDDGRGPVSLENDGEEFLSHLEKAFYFGMVAIYSQGMHMLYRASQEFNYDLKLDEVAKIWRGGCIIRSAFLEDIYGAYQKDQKLEHLFLDKNIENKLKSTIGSARKIGCVALNNAIPVPVLTTAIGYFDSITSSEMTTNLIQAQRDYFGAHTYELVGREGVFHTNWTGDPDVS
ncbi:UNVERIFIED_CONTAM: hypothetical protein GTU68_035709 [Idotea baltica]|nr:hypothetical protein [Idotea baltica]